MLRVAVLTRRGPGREISQDRMVVGDTAVDHNPSTPTTNPTRGLPRRRSSLPADLRNPKRLHPIHRQKSRPQSPKLPKRPRGYLTIQSRLRRKAAEAGELL